MKKIITVQFIVILLLLIANVGLVLNKDEDYLKTEIEKSHYYYSNPNCVEFSTRNFNFTKCKDGKYQFCKTVINPNYIPGNNQMINLPQEYADMLEEKIKPIELGE